MLGTTQMSSSANSTCALRCVVLRFFALVFEVALVIAISTKANRVSLQIKRYVRGALKSMRQTADGRFESADSPGSRTTLAGSLRLRRRTRRVGAQPLEPVHVLVFGRRDRCTPPPVAERRDPVHLPYDVDGGRDLAEDRRHVDGRDLRQARGNLRQLELRAAYRIRLRVEVHRAVDIGCANLDGGLEVDANE